MSLNKTKNNKILFTQKKTISSFMKEKEGHFKNTK